MAESRAASGLDRLPWLTDESEPRPRRKSRAYLPWAFAALLAIAAASYWFGMRASGDQALFDGRPSPRSTLALPQAQEMQPEMPALPEQIEITPVPQPPMPVIAEAQPVRLAPPPSARRPARTKAVKHSRVAPSKKPDTQAKAKAEVTPEKPSYTTTPWPVRVEEGAAGRLVRVGVFGSRHSAKRGWHALMRNNPSLQRLPALVVPVRSARNGRIYYRLQMGTSSQAHSTILCQRMRMIGQSCVVLTSEVQSA